MTQHGSHPFEPSKLQLPEIPYAIASSIYEPFALLSDVNPQWAEVVHACALTGLITSTVCAQETLPLTHARDNPVAPCAVRR